MMLCETVGTAGTGGTAAASDNRVHWRKRLLLDHTHLFRAWGVAFPMHDFGTGRLYRYGDYTFEAACRRTDAVAAKQPLDALTRRQRQLLESSAPLEAIYRAINDPRGRPTPQATVEAIVISVVERGLEALREPKNVERLSRCDEMARTEIQRRIVKLQAEGRVGVGLTAPDESAMRFMREMENDAEFQKIWRPAVDKFHKGNAR